MVINTINHIDDNRTEEHDSVDAIEYGASDTLNLLNATVALQDLQHKIATANLFTDHHDDGGKDIERIEKEKKEIEERDKKHMEFQKKNFLTVDAWDLYRNIILLKFDTKSNAYYMKKVCPRNTWNTEWKKITQNQFENPYLIMEDRKYGGINEHLMIVGEKTKRINYEKAKKILDQQRIEEKQEKMKQKKSTPQNDDIQERREPHPTKEQLKEDLIGV